MLFCSHIIYFIQKVQNFVKYLLQKISTWKSKQIVLLQIDFVEIELILPSWITEIKFKDFFKIKNNANYLLVFLWIEKKKNCIEGEENFNMKKL